MSEVITVRYSCICCKSVSVCHFSPPLNQIVSLFSEGPVLYFKPTVTRNQFKIFGYSLLRLI